MSRNSERDVLGFLCGRVAVFFVLSDGFKWDYLARANTPNLDALVARGLYVEKMIPTFQTKTFVNYYAMATGLHAESSGIISNSTWRDLKAKCRCFHLFRTKKWPYSMRAY